MTIKIDYAIGLIAFLHARLCELDPAAHNIVVERGSIGGCHEVPIHTLYIDSDLGNGEIRRAALELDESFFVVNYYDVKNNVERAARAGTYIDADQVHAQHAFLWSEISHHLRI
jgi:hypothetical protein